MTLPKVLIVDLGGSFGGVQVYLENLACLLRGRSELLALCANPKLQQSLRNRDVRTYGVKSLWGKPIQILFGMTMLLWLRMRGRVDTVWINGYAEIVLLPCARLLGCTAIATRHLTLDIEAGKPFFVLKRRMAQFLYKRFAFTADRIICVSEAVAKDLAGIVPQEKLTVIPNWMPSLPEPVISDYEKGRLLRLLFVGRLIPLKGASLILDAMRQMDGNDVALTVVGEGEYRQALECEAKGLNVRFVGFQRDPSDFYREADLFINPTLGPEGLPLVSLEAMSYGLPCILSDLPVHKEITDKGKYASLFRRGDAYDLCTKIKMFLSSPELLTKYGELGRNAVENRHSAEVARAMYVKALAL
jgi:glycosyltransferase involved in cell wall biosynthesis